MHGLACHFGGVKPDSYYFNWLHHREKTLWQLYYCSDSTTIFANNDKLQIEQVNACTYNVSPGDTNVKQGLNHLR